MAIRRLTNVLVVSFLGFIFIVSEASSNQKIPVDVANAPENDLPLTLKAFNDAKKSIFLNIYELTMKPIADALCDKIREGVTVQILEEGQPAAGMSSAGKAMQAQLVRCMKSNGNSNMHFFEMSSKAGGKRRYRFDHAKYAVLDNSSVLIGSENYSPSGTPQAGHLGNRGWQVLAHDSKLANAYQATFDEDSNTRFHDVRDLTDSSAFIETSDPSNFGIGNFLTDLFTTHYNMRSKANSDIGIEGRLSMGATAVHQITSPNTSLQGLLSLINDSKTTLDIQQMTFDSQWGSESERSPLLDAVIEAAKRGVKVRVLLNDESVFNGGGSPQIQASRPKNGPTVDTLNQLAKDENLPISAYIANLKAMGVDYIHNKGVVADGSKVLISSINWNKNAVMNNREAAVGIISTEIYKYYESLFQQDWEATVGSK